MVTDFHPVVTTHARSKVVFLCGLCGEVFVTTTLRSARGIGAELRPEASANVRRTMCDRGYRVTTGAKKKSSITARNCAIDCAEFTATRRCEPPSMPFVYHELSARSLLITQRS
jgi:hypothetical protein